MEFESVFSTIAVIFETAGVIVMIVGFVIALVLAARALARREAGEKAFTILRTTLGS